MRAPAVPGFTLKFQVWPRSSRRPPPGEAAAQTVNGQLLTTSKVAAFAKVKRRGERRKRCMRVDEKLILPNTRQCNSVVWGLIG
ncbi:hypothetical protein Sjap_020616 [Stephania japonica]|uniref:Uncharacterized protein n=1 Tax=Stephania japonica TaxID=461633 RepID=A0AAP0HZ57_9MAGN